MQRRLCQILRLCVAFSLAPACVPRARIEALEYEISALQAQIAEEAAQPAYELRLQSATVAIEKNRERLDRIVPPDAQWMQLEFGASLRWYVDAQIDTVYAQFLTLDSATGSVEVTFSTIAQQTTHRMRPGESVEHRLEGLDPPRGVALTLHRIHHTEGGASQALFSVVPVDGPL